MLEVLGSGAVIIIIASLVTIIAPLAIWYHISRISNQLNETYTALTIIIQKQEDEIKALKSKL